MINGEGLRRCSDSVAACFVVTLIANLFHCPSQMCLSHCAEPNDRLSPRTSWKTEMGYPIVLAEQAYSVAGY